MPGVTPRWRSRRRPSILVAAVVLLVGLAVAVISPVSRAMTSSSNSLCGLRFGVVAGALDPTLLTLMKSNDFLRAGIDANITVFDSGVPQVPALINGNLDMGFVAPAPLISIASQGTSIKAVAIAYANGKGIQGIVTHPDSGITSVEDLRGKSVGYISGSIQQYDLESLLATHHMTLSDIKSVNVPVALMPAAYQHKSVDALFAAQVAYQRIQSLGARIIAEQYQIPNAPAGGVAFYIARGDYISKYPVCMKRFARALDFAIQDVKNHPAQATALLRDATGITAAEAARVMARVATPPLATQVSPKYALNLNHGGMAKALTPIIQFMQSQGQLKSPVAAADILAPGPVASYVASQQAKKKPAKKKS